MLLDIKTLFTNIYNLQKSKIDIVLKITSSLVNIKEFYAIKIDDLLENAKLKFNNSNLSNDDKIKIFSILK